MKNKILITLIVSALVFTLLPGPVMASGNRINARDILVKKHKPTNRKIEKILNHKIEKVDDDEYIRQSLLEEVDGLYSDSFNGTYIEEVRTVIDEYWEELSNYINDTDISNLTPDYWDITDDVYQKILTLLYLTEFTDDEFKDSSYIETKKDLLLDKYNQAFNCYTSSNYNDYYLSIKNKYYNSYADKINDVNSFLSLASAQAFIEYDFEINFPEISFTTVDYSTELIAICPDGSNFYEDEDWGYEEDEYYEEDFDYIGYLSYEDFLEKVGIVSVPTVYLDFGVMYDSITLEDLRTLANYYLDIYVNNQLSPEQYTEELREIRENARDYINSSYNGNGIIVAFENCINKLIDKSGVEFEDLRVSVIRRTDKQIEKLSDIYTNKEVYSEEAIEKNQEIIDYAYEALSWLTYKAELPSDYIVKVEELLKLTKTKAQELKEAKTKYISYLNRFKNNKKYNQTLVVPIVNQGVKAINSATTIEKVKSVYNIYYKKALATINKYKITTMKVGKGTITKSSTVKYGNSFSVVMKPYKGYKISKVYVDGKKIKTVSKYTFKNVVKKHTIKVVFAKK